MKTQSPIPYKHTHNQSIDTPKTHQTNHTDTQSITIPITQNPNTQHNHSKITQSIVGPSLTCANPIITIYWPDFGLVSFTCNGLTHSHTHGLPVQATCQYAGSLALTQSPIRIPPYTSHWFSHTKSQSSATPFASDTHSTARVLDRNNHAHSHALLPLLQSP